MSRHISRIGGFWEKSRWIVCLSIFTHALLFPSQLKPPSQTELDLLYDSLTHPILDELQLAEVSGATFVRGGQKINLLSGNLRFFSPVRGKRFGAVFIGSGVITFAPPTEAEQHEFIRQTDLKLDSGSHQFHFERAVFWFADTLYEQLSRTCVFRSMSRQRSERDAVDRSLKFVSDPSNVNGIYRLLREMFDPGPQPYLLAHFLLDKDGNDLFLEYDLRRFEEVVIEQPYLGSSTGFNYWRVPVCSFHLPEEYTSLTEDELTQEEKREISVVSNTLQLKLRHGTSVDGNASVSFRRLGEPPAGQIFYLYPKLEMSSITGSSGEPVSFLRQKDSWETLVFLQPQDSDTYTIDFDYHGDFIRFARYFMALPRFKTGYTIDLRKERMLLLNTLGWYPRTGALEPSMFDMTFTIPDDLEIVAAGKKIRETKVGSERVLNYRTSEPSKIVSFSIGEYKETEVQLNKDEPVVKVFDITGGEPEKVGVDLASSVHFFTSMFGKIPYDEVKAASGPAGGGQAYPEFVVLPWIEEKVGDENFSVSIERAHEISHAWWGHGVGWRSYHDQWLSEGFAEYSSLLYALYVLKKDAPIFEELKKWRESITGARKFAFGSGAAVGSIWLGYRTSSNRSPDDVNLLIYAKAGFVLHMLRMMMMDLQTFKEDAFKAMMSDFYTSFKGLDPGTKDFQHVVEKYMRIDMSWFFKEWVYRTEIPTYKVKSEIARNDSGKWNITLSVQQIAVTDSFKMYVPIELKLKNGTSAFARVLINQPMNRFTYEVADEPEKVIFNPFEAVLCTVEE